ncbi:MAG: signal peptide peptidase SppA [Myxococcota bacterium]
MSFWQTLLAAALGVGVFLFVSLVALVGVGLTVWFIRSRLRKRLPKRMILEVDLSDPLTEEDGGEPLDRIFNRGGTPLRELLETFERAADDKRVLAVVVRCSEVSLGLAQAQEVRSAIRRLVAGGTPVVAYADTYGEGAPGWLSYFVASAASKVVVQPSGDLNLTGLMGEQPFFREALERLGVEPRFQQRYEYKSIVELFERRDMSPEAKEALRWIYDDVIAVMSEGVGAARKLSDAQMADVVAQGPHSAKEALELGLVDELAYRDQVYDALRKEHGEKVRFRYAAHYFERTKSTYEKGPVVALVTGTGDIMRGGNRFNPRSQTSSMGAETLCGALRAACDDDDVKAIVLRINTPGGSYIGSDTIWREVRRARDVKPVIAWFGDVAASGGYYIATHATAIVAQELTLTGSIGVAGGKFVLKGAFEKLGVRFDGVRTHDNATLFSANHDYDEANQRTIDEGFDRAYADFTGKVADGRSLDADAVDAVARGRVWTGRQAKERKLVDELGGFDTALGRAKREAKLDGGVTLRAYPRTKELWEQALTSGAVNSDEEGRAARVGLPAWVQGLAWIGELPVVLARMTVRGVQLRVGRFFDSTDRFWRR